MQQYAIHAGNAISALEQGQIDIVRRQIRLAQLASRKRLQAKRMDRTKPNAAPAVVEQNQAEETTPDIQQPAVAHDRSITLPRINLEHINTSASRTRIYLLLLVWSLGAAAIMDHLPAITPPVAQPQQATPYTGSTAISGLPVEGRITSGIGWRVHPVTGKRSYHAGIDIAAPAGTPIHATGAGTVIFAGFRNKNCGYGVIINHGDRKTIYCHMQQIADGITAGHALPAHAVIGYVGHTGRATGNHVHYEIQTIKQGGKQARGNYQQHINTYATANRLDPLLVQAVIWQESVFDPNAISRSGAIGLMQLMPETAEEIAMRLKMSSPDLYDPETNIRLGTAYLADLIRQFGRLDLALAAYNAGPGAVRKHGGIPPYRQTRTYVSRITGYYNNLKKEA